MNSRLHNKRRGSRWNLLKKEITERREFVILLRNMDGCHSPRLRLQTAAPGTSASAPNPEASLSISRSRVGFGHNRCKGLLIRVSRASAFLAGSSLDSCGGPSLPCPLPSRPRPLLTGHHRHWGPLLKHLHSLTNSFPVNFLQNHVDTPRESLC